MQLDTYAGDLILEANGKDSAVVGKLIRYEERDRKIRVSEQRSQDKNGADMIVVLPN